MSDYLRQEVIQDPRNKKSSFQKYIKKLIIYFFVMMLVLTFVSRAADSVLVAKVTLTTARKGELIFRFQGSGRITENAKQYLDLYEGVHISKIHVREGAKVKQGDLLFQYDTRDLKEKYEEAQNEILKAELNYQKAKLETLELTADTAADDAELALQRAELDLSLARQEQQMSKDRIKKNMKESCEAAQKEYETALDTCDEQETKMNREVMQANRLLQKALETRSEQDEARKPAETVLGRYRLAVEGLTENAEDIISGISGKVISTNTDNLGHFIYDINNKFINILNSLYNYSPDVEAAIEQKEQQAIDNNVPSVKQEEMDKTITAVDDIFRCYYGDEKYIAHKNEVEAAEKKLERIKEDYACSMIVAAEYGRTLTTEDKLSYIRQYEDAITALEEATSEDRKLIEAITAYGYALVKKDPTEIENTYATLFSSIYREDKTKTKEIKAADDAVEAAREALSEVTAEWTDITAKAKKQAEDLRTAYEEKNEIYQQMLDGTYDYTEEVWAEEKQVESAIRAVEDAKINVEKAYESDDLRVQKQKKDKELEKLDHKLYELELEEKHEIADELEEMIKQDGKVTSPADANIVDIGIEEGSITTGTEKVAITVDGYSLQIYVAKEEAKRIELGDELTIETGRQKERITVPITGIGEVDDEGKVEITGAMPEGEYSIGAEVSYELTKKTKQYPLTIPITALHSDSNGNYYVLVPEENNTVLGNELIARKIAITLIDQCDTTAAVDGNLYSVSIISGANKNIEAGDRVRSVIID